MTEGPVEGITKGTDAQKIWEQYQQQQEEIQKQQELARQIRESQQSVLKLLKNAREATNNELEKHKENLPPGSPQAQAIIEAQSRLSNLKALLGLPAIFRSLLAGLALMEQFQDKVAGFLAEANRANNLMETSVDGNGYLQDLRDGKTITEEQKMVAEIALEQDTESPALSQSTLKAIQDGDPLTEEQRKELDAMHQAVVGDNTPLDGLNFTKEHGSTTLYKNQKDYEEAKEFWEKVKSGEISPDGSAREKAAYQNAQAGIKLPDVLGMESLYPSPYSNYMDMRDEVKDNPYIDQNKIESGQLDKKTAQAELDRIEADFTAKKGNMGAEEYEAIAFYEDLKSGKISAEDQPLTTEQRNEYLAIANKKLAQNGTYYSEKQYREDHTAYGDYQKRLDTMKNNPYYDESAVKSGNYDAMISSIKGDLDEKGVVFDESRTYYRLSSTDDAAKEQIDAYQDTLRQNDSTLQSLQERTSMDLKNAVKEQESSNAAMAGVLSAWAQSIQTAGGNLVK